MSQQVAFTIIVEVPNEVAISAMRAFEALASGFIVHSGFSTGVYELDESERDAYIASLTADESLPASALGLASSIASGWHGKN